MVISSSLLVTSLTALRLHFQSGLSKELFDVVEGLLIGCSVAWLIATRRMPNSQ